MPSLIYTPVLLTEKRLPGMQALTMLLEGVPPFGDRDGGLCWAHHPSSLPIEAEALYLHLRESTCSQGSICYEGEEPAYAGHEPHTDGMSLQITFIFILILFLDSVNRVYRVQVELAAYSKDGGGAA